VLVQRVAAAATAEASAEKEDEEAGEMWEEEERE